MTRTAETERGEILVAVESAVFQFEGADVVITRDVTRVRAGHPILRGREHLFRPLDAHYEIEQATAAPGEVRGA